MLIISQKEHKFIIGITYEGVTFSTNENQQTQQSNFEFDETISIEFIYKSTKANDDYYFCSGVTTNCEGFAREDLVPGLTSIRDKNKETIVYLSSVNATAYTSMRSILTNGYAQYTSADRESVLHCAIVLNKEDFSASYYINGDIVLTISKYGQSHKLHNINFYTAGLNTFFISQLKIQRGNLSINNGMNYPIPQ